MDRGAWRATVHGVTKSQTQLSTCVHTHTHAHTRTHTHKEEETLELSSSPPCQDTARRQLSAGQQ